MSAWDQQASEGSGAFGLFMIFLKLGPDRDIAEVVDKSGRAEKLVRRVSHKFRWHKRARQYDQYMARVELAAIRRELERDAVKWAKRFSQVREIEFTEGMALVEQARKMRAFPLTEETVTEKLGPVITDFETGEKVQTKTVIIKVQPTKWSRRDIKEFLESASKLMRLATGKETERTMVGIDIFGTGNEKLTNARDLYLNLCATYADRPDILELLPEWLSEYWGVEPRQITSPELIEGELIEEPLSSSSEH